MTILQVNNASPSAVIKVNLTCYFTENFKHIILLYAIHCVACLLCTLYYKIQFHAHTVTHSVT